MRVLACYADGLRQEAYRAMVNNIPVGSLEMVNVSGDPTAYWREFRARWRGEYDLMTVEQDNVITADCFSSFAACDQPWCSYAYQAQGPGDGTVNSMGCARFARELQRAVPFSQGDVDDQRMSAADYHWQWMDAVMAGCFRDKGFEPHVHGEVEHLHDYGSAGTMKNIRM